MVNPVALVVTDDGFNEAELQTVAETLRQYGVTPLVIGKTRKTLTGSGGLELQPAAAIGELEPEHFSALVFLSGSTIGDYFNDEVVFKLVHRFVAARKPLAAIADAPLILGNAGVLMGKMVTALPWQEQNLLSRGAEYTGMPLEIDGKILTAREGVEKAFAEALINLIGA